MMILCKHQCFNKMATNMHIKMETLNEVHLNEVSFLSISVDNRKNVKTFMSACVSEN